MGNVVVTTLIGAPPERVWRALTVPAEVSAWDGVAAVAVAADYPTVGEHARWRTALGPLRLVLHDRISVVDPPVRFAARIDVGFVHVEEEYRLAPTPDGGTELVT
ncbi:MAG TPA: SRPBCC family protein, partial [Acidimicrobiia bacterium]|nr:SRPBCC family protein [Acidimicrobiia bacterium]